MRIHGIEKFKSAADCSQLQKDVHSMNCGTTIEKGFEIETAVIHASFLTVTANYLHPLLSR